MKAATLTAAARSAPGMKTPKAVGHAVRLLCCLLVVALVGCEDKGKAEYQAAYDRYQALVTEGRRPNDPAFDEVVKKLEAVPASSAASGKAKSLREAILRSRKRLAPRPLAVPGARDGGVAEDPKVQAKQQECVRLAQAIGTAKPEERDAAVKKLQACKVELIQLEEQGHEDTPR